MRILTLPLALLVPVLGLDPFLQFTAQYGKQYHSRAELEVRRSVFRENWDRMETHNARFDAGEETWTRAVYSHYDLTVQEFSDVFLSGFPVDPKTPVFPDTTDEPFLARLAEVSATGAPPEWSWVSQGGVSSVKDQGMMGSSAAFATVAILETCFWQQGSVMPDLSEQHLMSCSGLGCTGGGGWPPAYIDWIVGNNSGKVQTESFPTTDSCTCHPEEGEEFQYGRVTGMYNRMNTNETAMKEVVYLTPATTSMQASYLSGYKTGIYDDPRCCEQETDENCKYKVNHEVTVVGWGTEAGVDYWLVKNSWGPWWGENGFFRIKRGTGHCGIGSLHYTAAYCTPSV